MGICQWLLKSASVGDHPVPQSLPLRFFAFPAGGLFGLAAGGVTDQLVGCLALGGCLLLVLTKARMEFRADPAAQQRRAHAQRLGHAGLRLIVLGHAPHGLGLKGRLVFAPFIG